VAREAQETGVSKPHKRRTPNRYIQLLEQVFKLHYEPGASRVCFARTELKAAAAKLRLKLPDNLGDVIYSFRYRASLPESIRSKAPKGQEWVIMPAGRSQYCFVAVSTAAIVPAAMMAEVKVPDSTPGVIEKYRLSDEQALLAKLRYNRLLDIFTGVTCYSLQNHLRTTVPGMGQVETDELYIGIDRRGAHYVIPVQAKGGKDRISIVVQIQQDYAMCRDKFPDLICRPVAAQFYGDNIAVFAFENTDAGLRVAVEKHYRLVAQDQVTPEDLKLYSESVPVP
jgi:hypothetical protein